MLPACHPSQMIYKFSIEDFKDDTPYHPRQDVTPCHPSQNGLQYLLNPVNALRQCGNRGAESVPGFAVLKIENVNHANEKIIREKLPLDV